MKMKERIQNWATTIIGAIIIILGLSLYTLSQFKDFQIGLVEFITLMVLGWVFLTSKNTLLEGVFLNIFRIKKSDDNADSE